MDDAGSERHPATVQLKGPPIRCAGVNVIVAKIDADDAGRRATTGTSLSMQ
jgi:hypothetical protein